MARQTDGALLHGIREHDSAAFDALLARYRVAVSRHLLAIVRHDALAEDLTQELFLRVWLHAEQWDGRGAVRGWLFRIATNLALNQLRALHRRRELSLETLPECVLEGEDNPAPGWMIDTTTLGPEAACEARERRQLLWRIVDELPEEKREVIRLVHEEELALHDAATALGVPEGTVKSRLHYARKQLADAWHERWEE